MTIDSRLRAYREPHKIKPAWVFSDDLNRLVQVCAHDTIRVAKQGNGYRHDAGFISTLARGEDVERL